MALQRPLELFNLIVARQAPTGAMFSLYAYCCHLCEIQGIFWEFCLGAIMAHCQTVCHPESPRGITYRIPAWMSIVVTVCVVSGWNCHRSNSITKKNGWVGKKWMTESWFCGSVFHSRAEVALGLLCSYSLIYVLISQLYIILDIIFVSLCIILLRTSDVFKWWSGKQGVKGVL